MGLGRVPPLGSGGRKIFFFTFRLGIDGGSSPTRFEPRRAHILGATGVRSGGLAYTSIACLARLAILTHSGRASVGVASEHVPVRRFLLPVAILTRFDASFGGAVLRRARHASPARPQAVRLPRLSAEGVRDGGATRLSGLRCPITPRRLKHVASYPHPSSSGAAFTMQTVYGGFPAPGLGSGGEPMFARPPGDQFGYLVDPASSICLSQRLSHASLSTHGRYSETANGSLNQLWFL